MGPRALFPWSGPLRRHMGLRVIPIGGSVVRATNNSKSPTGPPLSIHYRGGTARDGDGLL
jgi:hypothetical protein